MRAEIFGCNFPEPASVSRASAIVLQTHSDSPVGTLLPSSSGFPPISQDVDDASACDSIRAFSLLSLAKLLPEIERIVKRQAP